jgi:hypothetical protein
LGQVNAIEKSPIPDPFKHPGNGIANAMKILDAAKRH